MFTTLLFLLSILLALTGAGASFLRARRAAKSSCATEIPCAVELPDDPTPETPLPDAESSTPSTPVPKPKPLQKPKLAQATSDLDALIAEHEAFMREYNRERRERYKEYRREGLLPPLKPRKRREPKPEALSPFPSRAQAEPLPTPISHQPSTQAPPSPPPIPQPAPTPPPETPTTVHSESPFSSPPSLPFPKRPLFSFKRLFTPLTKFLFTPWRILKPALIALPRLGAQLFLRRRPPNSGPPPGHASTPPLHSRAA